MNIPRLPPAANPVDINLHVNVKLVPYFTKFYQDTKLTEDTPETFLLRVMKKLVIDHYTLNSVRDALYDQKNLYELEIESIVNDSNLINTEVD